jgi:prevent-host-death family protein
MFTIKEDTTLVGVSELRTKLEKIIEEAKFRKVIIEKRNKPVAVLVAIDKYNAMEELLDKFEDYELANKAKQREKRSSKKDYIALEEAFRKFKQ